MGALLTTVSQLPGGISPPLPDPLLSVFLFGAGFPDPGRISWMPTMPRLALVPYTASTLVHCPIVRERRRACLA